MCVDFLTSLLSCLLSFYFALIFVFEARESRMEYTLALNAALFLTFLTLFWCFFEPVMKGSRLCRQTVCVDFLTSLLSWVLSFYVALIFCFCSKRVSNEVLVSCCNISQVVQKPGMVWVALEKVWFWYETKWVCCSFFFFFLAVYCIPTVNPGCSCFFPSLFSSDGIKQNWDKRREDLLSTFQWWGG